MHTCRRSCMKCYNWKLLANSCLHHPSTLDYDASQVKPERAVKSSQVKSEQSSLTGSKHLFASSPRIPVYSQDSIYALAVKLCHAIKASVVSSLDGLYTDCRLVENRPILGVISQTAVIGEGFQTDARGLSNLAELNCTSVKGQAITLLDLDLVWTGVTSSFHLDWGGGGASHCFPKTAASFFS